MGKLEVRELHGEGRDGNKKYEVLVFIVFASGIRFGERKIDPGELTLREISF